MKYVLLAMFVLSAAQPLTALSCDMHASQGINHDQHGTMQDSDMQDMDCCDHDPIDQDDGCDPFSQCRVGTSASAAISPSIINIILNPGSLKLLYRDYEPLNNFSSPPFRPPIT
jgi:hypothetical protein